MDIETPTWDDLRVLLAVHRGKSFLAAGKLLAVATSTVARRVEMLEYCSNADVRIWKPRIRGEPWQLGRSTTAGSCGCSSEPATSAV